MPDDAQALAAMTDYTDYLLTQKVGVIERDFERLIKRLRLSGSSTLEKRKMN